MWHPSPKRSPLSYVWIVCSAVAQPECGQLLTEAVHVEADRRVKELMQGGC